MLWGFTGTQSFPSQWELFFLLCLERSVTTGFWQKENKARYFSSHSNCVSAQMTVCSLNLFFSTVDPFIQLQHKVRFQMKQRLTSVLIWQEALGVNAKHASVPPNLNHTALKPVCNCCWARLADYMQTNRDPISTSELVNMKEEEEESNGRRRQPLWLHPRRSTVD